MLKLGLNFENFGDQTDLIIMLMVPQFMAIGKIGRGQLNERRPHRTGWRVSLHWNNGGQSRLKETRWLLFVSIYNTSEGEGRVENFISEGKPQQMGRDFTCSFSTVRWQDYLGREGERGRTGRFVKWLPSTEL